MALLSSVAVAARIVTNDELAETLNLDTTDEWIRTRTGIRSRRFAGSGETSASLGTAAASYLAMSKPGPGRIDRELFCLER
ncbi:MAG: hypothetical protein U0792_09670 [Gemmataceae bacterium]